ncbi:Serine protease, subtilisin family [Streptomyces zhaozhouensis]|uniref:Serine protease, subtilisin family n=1 Tax=Streptomyces zhaozhouensis TaxID=1300267 RepID=A0A286DXP5_9ACTN|nr:S8 family serine peptidase [Streptomyces zhaozhouensis]SOD63406.1 Serine protease, subtilisin family [Streptomyces zhaozhouensis]
MAAAVVLALAGGSLLAAPATASPSEGTAPVESGQEREITLITGDRVRLGPGGEVRAVLPGSGREGVAFEVSETDDATLVIPSDARGPLAEGLVDLRLFDVGELSHPAYARLVGDGIPVIASYGGEPPARPFADEGVTHRAALTSIDAEAMTVSPEGAAGVWEALTGPAARGAGLVSLRLDALRSAALDHSVPRIGAPAAWEAGFDGTGVTVAVLDSGIDTSHPDLDEGRVVGSADFSGSDTTEDLFGHGTHVASIVGGAGGALTGVAPGADLLNGKVMDDSGFGTDSGIIAGMEWAVAQGADIVNMSLGGADTPEVDPLEEAVNRLSAESDTLFVLSAGNSGPGPASIGSPGSADAALTVGSVDRDDALAHSSSIGPRVGDAALKPDLTAPGVDIAAAAAEGSYLEGGAEPAGEGYMRLSGTSMAAPHVAGAAALLAQRHPDWSGERLKAALVASAAPVEGQTAFQQGAGRVDAAAAIGQSVVAEPVSLSFGAQQWPHADNAPVVRELTYSNPGAEDVTLDLALRATGPEGAPAPEGTFRLGADAVTVPAGGTATVEVTADTAFDEATPVGAYSAFVTATGGGHTVGTAGAIALEGQFHELTVEGVGLDGAPHAGWSATLVDRATGESTSLFPEDGSAVLRLPDGGEYLLLAHANGDDWEARHIAVLAPLDGDATVTFDARQAEEIDLTVPDGDAEEFYAFNGVELPDLGVRNGWERQGKVPLRTQHMGPALGDDELVATHQTSWAAGASEYHAEIRTAGRYFTGHEHAYTPEEFAELRLTLGAPTGDTTGRLTVAADRRAGQGPERALPAEATLYLSAGDWSYTLGFTGPGEAGSLTVAERAVEAGETFTDTMGVGVFAPPPPAAGALTRGGDRLVVALTTVSDGAGHAGYLSGGTGFTTLSYEGEVIGEREDFLRGWADFEVPAAEGRYELTTTALRPDAGVSTEISATFGFTSGSVLGDEPLELPVSLVRFSPELAPDSTAEAGRPFDVPVTVEGAAAQDGPASLAVRVSYDGGASWEETPVEGGSVTVANPEAGGSVSFRAELTDRDGNTTEQTILDAYRTR